MSHYVAQLQLQLQLQDLVFICFVVRTFGGVHLHNPKGQQKQII